MENNEGILASQSSIGAAMLENPPVPARPSARIARPKPTKIPLISVIIPAHNEQNYIRQTLEAVKRQTHGAFEIVVVTNGCTDQTAEIARALCDQLIVMPERGLSRARNLGGQAARGKLLLFLDADTLLERHALEVIAQRFGPDCAAGTLKGRPDIARPSYKLMYAVKNFQHWSGLHEGSSGIILCWKDHFIATGGFDEALHVTENSDLIRKLRFFGKYAFISETAVTTSMRRYESGGWARIVRMWVKLWVQSLVSDLRHEKYEAVR